MEDRIERWDPAVRDSPDFEKFVKPRDRQPPSKDRWDKTVNSMSKPRCRTSRGDEPVSRAGEDGAVDPLAESIIYVCSLIADQPRAIDRYIDYFGETRSTASLPLVPLSHPRFRAFWPTVSNQWAATSVGRALMGQSLAVGWRSDQGWPTTESSS